MTSCWHFVVSTNAVTRKQPDKRKNSYYKMKTHFMSFNFRVETSVNDCFSHLKLVFFCVFVCLIKAYFMIFLRHNYLIIFALVGPSD